MKQLRKWVIRSKHGPFLGPGRMVQNYEEARKYTYRLKAELDLKTLQENLNGLSDGNIFFLECWEMD